MAVQGSSVHLATEELKLRTGIAMPEFTEKLDVEGAVRVSMPQPEFARWVREAVARWRDLIRRSGIKVVG